MSNSTAPPRIAGLSALAANYPVILSDVWGVVHNGVRAFAEAGAALARHRAAGGVVILITNAPRLAPHIVAQLDQLGVDRAAYDDIVTSGDVTRELLARRHGGKVLHIGTKVHLPLYEGLDLSLVSGDDADIISCTGLRDDEHESPDDYDAELRLLAARDLPMICANPDMVVERGEKLVWCAGALAERYRSFGGRSEIAGKPHHPIYEAALARAAAIAGRPIERAEVLAIGDGAPTDVKGACAEGLDLLFVTGGIHAGNFGPLDRPDDAAVGRFLAAEGLAARAFVPRLEW